MNLLDTIKSNCHATADGLATISSSYTGEDLSDKFHQGNIRTFSDFYIYQESKYPSTMVTIKLCVEDVGHEWAIVRPHNWGHEYLLIQSFENHSLPSIRIVSRSFVLEHISVLVEVCKWGTNPNTIEHYKRSVERLCKLLKVPVFLPAIITHDINIGIRICTLDVSWTVRFVNWSLRVHRRLYQWHKSLSRRAVFIIVVFILFVMLLISYIRRSIS